MLPSHWDFNRSNMHVRPFDQNLAFPLIYFFYLHMTIRQKYMAFFHLIFLLYTTIRQKLGSSLIYFFCVGKTIRPKYMVLFHLFFFLCATIRPKTRVHTDLLLLFEHDDSTKIYGPLSFILSLVHDHSTKN